MIKGLDGLRAIAVALVVLQHYCAKLVNATQIYFGTIGVLVFFALSGFLITRILLKSRELDAKNVMAGFFARRFLRIFPIYYLTVIITPLLGYQMMGAMQQWNILYASNIFIFTTGKWPNEASHLWSLALEEQFYLIWPIVILFTPKKYMVPIFVAACISSPISRYILQDIGAPSASIKTFPLSSVEYLVLGAFLAYLEYIGALERALNRIGVIAFLSTTVIAIDKLLIDFMPSYLLMSTALPIAAYAISYIYCNQSSIIVKLLTFRPIESIGKMSYGIYLYHNFMPRQAGYLSEYLGLGLTQDQKYMTAVVITLIVSWISFNLFEKQILKMKKFFPYSRKESGLPSQAGLLSKQ